MRSGVPPPTAASVYYAYSFGKVQTYDNIVSYVCLSSNGSSSCLDDLGLSIHAFPKQALRHCLATTRDGLSCNEDRTGRIALARVIRLCMDFDSKTSSEIKWPG